MKWRRALIWVWSTATTFWGLTVLMWGNLLYQNKPSLFHVSELLAALLGPIVIAWTALYVGFWIAGALRGYKGEG